MFSGINSLFFGSSAPTLPSQPLKSVEDWKKMEEELYKSSYAISEKLFAHRLTSAYLEKTTFVGLNSYNSVIHWMEILKLWCAGQGQFLSLPISQQHLVQLYSYFSDYAATLWYYQNELSVDFRAKAQKTIQDIQLHLSHKKVYYTPLGYAGGVKSGGHAIPLKLCDCGDYFEATLLNLGEGVHLHPRADCDHSGSRFSFQSFPVRIRKTVFASKKCEDIFTRLIQIQLQSYSADVPPYTAEDIYLAIYSLGEVQGSFPSPVAQRARKSQLGNRCGDEVSRLIKTDFLVDQHYHKHLIHRLVTLEKLIDILLFFNQLKQKNCSLDSWILLQHGIKEFSIRISKPAHEALTKEETERLHDMIKPMVATTGEQILALKKETRPLFCIEGKFDPSQPSFVVNYPKGTPPCTPKNIIIKAPSEKKQGDLLISDPIPTITPQNVSPLLAKWAEKVRFLSETEQPHRAHECAYQIMCSLEIPQHQNVDFWDAVDAHEITSIIEFLSLLAQHGVQVKTTGKHRLFYRNVLLMSIGYAITDKLVRRKYPQYFKDFASPFIASKFELNYYSNKFIEKLNYSTLTEKEAFFDLHLLPLASANIRWKKICTYFEKQLAESNHTIFAYEEEEHPNIHQILRDYREVIGVYQTWSPSKHYIKFLEQFLEKAFPSDSQLSLPDKFLALWENKGDRYLPSEIAILNFFAFYSRFCCRYIPTRRPTPRVECIKQKHPDIAADKIPSAFQENLGVRPFDQWRAAQKRTENEIFCYPNTEDREWWRIFSIPNLQITSLIFWMRNNISLLGQEEVRQKITMALFMPGLLADKIASEPLILEQLREVIGIALTSYGNMTKSGFETSLYLIRMGVAIETYAPCPSLETLARYETFLLKCLEQSQFSSTSICYHLLFLYQQGLPRDKLSLIELIKARFWLTYHDVDGQIPPWLLAETLAPLERHRALALKLFSEQEWKGTLAAELLSLLFKKTFSSTQNCTGTYPVIEQGEWRIDIESQAVFQGNLALVFLNKTKRGMDRLFDRSSGLFWQINNTLIACSGHAKIELSTDGKCLIAKQFPQLAGSGLEKTWFERGTVDAAYFPDSLLSNSNNFDHWMNGETIVICKKNQTTPLYISLPCAEGHRVHKIGEKELHPIGPLLLDFYSSQESLGELLPELARLGNREEICVWINQKTGYIEGFEFLLLNISFEYRDGRFYCQNYPEFFLAEEQGVEELNFFKGTLVLQHGIEKMVLLPVRHLDKSNHNFAIQVSYQADFVAQAAMEGTKFFLYQLDEIRGLLIHPEAQANLYLVLLLAMQREYTKARIYLQRSQAFHALNKEAEWIFKSIYALKDDSPPAIAFYLEFGLFLIKNIRQLLINSYKDHTSLENEFFHWLGTRCERYLTLYALNDVSRIPAEMRLTPKEEIFMFDIMKRILERGDRENLHDLSIRHKKLSFLPKQIVDSMIASTMPKGFWRHSFDMRLDLLEEGEYNSIISPSFYSFTNSNFIYMLLSDRTGVLKWDKPSFVVEKPPEEFVRLTESEIKKYFLILYERVQVADKGDVDLFYLMRSCKIQSSVFCAYCMLLNYVNKFPHEFKDLKFTHDPIVNEKVFNSIVAIADNLFAKLSKTVDTIKTIVQKELIFFPYTKLIEIKKNPPQSFSQFKWGVTESKYTELIQLRHGIYNIFCKSDNTGNNEYWLETEQQPIFCEEVPFAFTSLIGKPRGRTQHALVQKIQSEYLKLFQPEYGKTLFKLKEGKTIQTCLEKAKEHLKLQKEVCLSVKNKARRLPNGILRRHSSLA